MRKWSEQHTAKTGEGTTVKEGDVVKLKAPVTVWDQKSGNNKTFPPGTKATILSVLPKVGTADQMVGVQVKPNHDPEYMRAEDVSLHKAAPATIPEAEIPKSKILQQFQSNDGATVTVLKTPQTRDYEPRTIQDLANQPSYYKGQFQRVEGVIVGPDRKTRLYDSSPVPASRWGREGPATAAYRPGQTVWVERFPDKVVVREQSYQRWGFKARGEIKWTYKNVGAAFGMLKQRYGISIPLGKERF